MNGSHANWQFKLDRPQKNTIYLCVSNLSERRTATYGCITFLTLWCSHYRYEFCKWLLQKAKEPRKTDNVLQSCIMGYIIRRKRPALRCSNKHRLCLCIHLSISNIHKNDVTKLGSMLINEYK